MDKLEQLIIDKLDNETWLDLSWKDIKIYYNPYEMEWLDVCDIVKKLAHSRDLNVIMQSNGSNVALIRFEHQNPNVVPWDEYIATVKKKVANKYPIVTSNVSDALKIIHA